MKVLIIFGHPAFQMSTVNKELIRGLDQIDGVTFHDIYEEYPEMDIDIDHEQALLKEHDCIVFMHPFYWYSTPAIFKEWQDLVLEHGWAYGSEGNELKGKIFFSVITTGGPQIAYQRGGYQNYTIRDLLAPIFQTAILCKMTLLPPFVTHGTHRIAPEKVEAHRTKYHRILRLLVNDEFDTEAARKLEYLNEYTED